MMARYRKLAHFVFGRRIALVLSVFYLFVLISSWLIQRSVIDEHLRRQTSFLRAKLNEEFEYLTSLEDEVKHGGYEKTLALLSPPGMVGGYRNQVIRLVSLVRYAQQNNISQLLLPTILFSTTYHGQSNKMFFPIPMEEVFDIEHWNSFQSELPMLISSIEGGDCWGNNTTRRRSEEIDGFDDYPTSIAMRYNESLRKLEKPQFKSPMAATLLEKVSFLTPVSDINRALLLGDIIIQKPRKLDLNPLVEHCSHPYVYGGGRGAGKLWNSYTRMAKYDPTSDENTEEAVENSKLISLVSHQALRPSEKWRNVAQQCVRHFQPKSGNRMAPYVALHARVEVTMMNHRCGAQMEKNLTNIFSMVDSMVEGYNKATTDELQGVFVAVSRDGMLEQTRDQVNQQLATDNWQTLVSRSNSWDQAKDLRPADESVLYFECGESWMNQWYSAQKGSIPDDYYGSLVPSVLNFYIATQAEVFVGVAGSSWSTDVWTSRYYQGKGSKNFQYTPAGIFPVANNGLPPPHDNCSNHTKHK
eukprot:scaffold22680_cov107-Cylindrotheca_fusiformis.AAC.31